MTNKIFACFGGDTRQSLLIQMLKKEGKEVVSFSVPNVSDTLSDYKKIISLSDVIILPLPLTRDGITVNGCSNEITINKVLENSHDKLVFAGNISKEIFDFANKNSIKLFDYLKPESVSILNAIPTAEGAISIAMNETNYTINGSKTMVIGYGRIGKILSHMLKGIGAEVYVAARKESDIAYIKSNGYIPVKYAKIKESIENMNIIFNTVPVMVLDKEILDKLDPSHLIIDLASLPGGVDFLYAKSRNIKAVQALSLPGKVAPLTAASIIKDTIFNYLREESI